MGHVLGLALNPTVDITWEIDHLEATGKNRARLLGVVAGGGGVNVVRGVLALGGQAMAIHTAGLDVGRRLNRLLDEEDVPHVAVDVAGETREAVILLEAQAHRTFHIVPPGPRLSEEEGKGCLAALEESAGSFPYVVLSGSLPDGLPEDFYAQAAHRIQAAGSRVVLDTSAPALRPALAEGVFLAKPNKREAASIIGRDVDSFDDAREAAAQLLDREVAEVIVLTVGELGALCATREGRHEIRTPPLPREALSDAGAGDSFVAAMTLRLAQGDDPVDACASGVAAAAASVLTPGTQLFDPAEVGSLRPLVQIM